MNRDVRHLLCHFLLFLGVILAGAASVQAGEFSRYFGRVAAGADPSLGFRTVFHLRNETPEAVTGRLEFFSEGGEPLAIPLDLSGTSPLAAEVEDGRVVFRLEPAGILEVILNPSPTPSIGWARLMASAPLVSQARIQVGGPLSPLDVVTQFEDRLEEEAELFAAEPSRSLTFPVEIYRGLQNLDTALAVVNTSGAAAQVELSLPVGPSRQILLLPRESLAGFVDEILNLVFPATEITVFPLRFKSVLSVKSKARLAVSAFRTLHGLPISGLELQPQDPGAPPQEVPLGEEFSLKAGESARLDSGRLTLTFWDVLSDSRCPTDVLCIDAGQVRIQFRAHQDSVLLGEVELVARAGSPELGEAVVGDYTVQLLQVEPQPVSTTPLLM